jgi:hypothetical protein
MEETMATRAQRNRFQAPSLPELPKRRDAKRDALIDWLLLGTALVIGAAYFLFA